MCLCWPSYVHIEKVYWGEEREDKRNMNMLCQKLVFEKNFFQIHLRNALSTKRWPCMYTYTRAHKIIMRERSNLQRSFVINFFMVFQHLTSDWASAGGLRASVKLFWKRETKTKWKKINKTAKCTEAKRYKNFFNLNTHTLFMQQCVCLVNDNDERIVWMTWIQKIYVSLLWWIQCFNLTFFHSMVFVRKQHFSLLCLEKLQTFFFLLSRFNITQKQVFCSIRLLMFLSRNIHFCLLLLRAVVTAHNIFFFAYSRCIWERANVLSKKKVILFFFIFS